MEIKYKKGSLKKGKLKTEQFENQIAFKDTLISDLVKEIKRLRMEINLLESRLSGQKIEKIILEYVKREGTRGFFNPKIIAQAICDEMDKKCQKNKGGDEK